MMSVAKGFNGFERAINESEAVHQTLRAEMVGPSFSLHELIAGGGDATLVHIGGPLQDGAKHNVVGRPAERSQLVAEIAFADDFAPTTQQIGCKNRRSYQTAQYQQEGRHRH